MRPILPIVATLALCLVPQFGYAAAQDNLVVKINVAVYQLSLVWNTDGATVVPADGSKTSEQRTWTMNGVWYDGFTLASDGVTLAGIYNTNQHGRMSTGTVTGTRVTTDIAWTSFKNKTGADVDLSVKATNGTWSVFPSAAAVLLGTDRTRIEVSKDAGATYLLSLTTTNQVLANESVGTVIAADQIVPFDMRLTAPKTGSSITSGDLFVTVTSFISP